jgi:hypothetical protein
VKDWAGVVGALTGVNLLEAVPQTPKADFGGEEESSVEDGVAANCLSELHGRMVIRHRGGFFGEVDKYEDVG